MDSYSIDLRQPLRTDPVPHPRSRSFLPARFQLENWGAGPCWVIKLNHWQRTSHESRRRTGGFSY
eukprot:1666048-Rhodomonas_salina.1